MPRWPFRLFGKPHTMRIYISHSRTGEWQRDLYQPLQASALAATHELVFPHTGAGDSVFDSRSLLPTVGWVIAEVSEPSLSVGIELGWANLYGVPIIFCHRRGTAVSPAAQSVAAQVIEYQTPAELVAALQTALASIQPHAA